MWQSLEAPWKAVFEKGWEAFVNGSIPIGAVIADENGSVIIAGRNHVFERTTPNPRIAHAEMECLLGLDKDVYPHVKQYTLYTSMEPCPMCFGTIVMSGIRTVKIAARDAYCGATHYGQFDPYIKSKNMNITLERGALEMLQLIPQIYFELRRYDGRVCVVADKMIQSNPEAGALALELYKTSDLDQRAAEGCSFACVADFLASKF